MGGQQNTLRSVTDPCRRSVIIGGRVNRIEDAKDGAIVGSDTCVVDIATGNHCGIYTSVDSTISGSNADGMTIIGGNGASITEAPYSLIGGTDTACTHGGCFMYSDSAGGTALSSSATHEFSVRCSGGARFFSNTANTLGVSLAAGGAAWAAISDRNMKDLHGEVNQTQILSQVRQLPIHRYNYKGQDEDMIYIGPMAQDWHRLFPSGKDPLKIDTTDPVGVALACCQALDARIDDEAESADREMIRLERKIDELSSRLDVFEALTSRG